MCVDFNNGSGDSGLTFNVWTRTGVASRESAVHAVLTFADSPPVQNVHCIGDRANHIVLNAMEKALMELPEHERSGRRLRIEHAQIMKLEDLERAAKLGSESSGGTSRQSYNLDCSCAVIASYQPTHATSDVSNLPSVFRKAINVLCSP